MRATLTSILNLSEKYRSHVTTSLPYSEIRREDIRPEELNTALGTFTSSIALPKIALPTLEETMLTHPHGTKPDEYREDTSSMDRISITPYQNSGYQPHR
uniref:Uncharacterized protein n=1 Tax=Heterorhabditis bacteriophora TaxID=37862 RepID=A0A1I7WGU6_HETBA